MLKKYMSKKSFHAEPMNSSTWLFLQSGYDSYLDTVPFLDCNQEGYHLVYNLGEEDECHSWCSKRDFEATTVEADVMDYGINHDEGFVDVIFGDGLTGIQPAGYGDKKDGKYCMAGVVISRDGKQDAPFGTNPDNDLYLTKEDKVYLRSTSAESLQILIDKLEVAKSYLIDSK